MDIKLFLEAAVQGIPLLFPVFVLVELLKSFKRGDTQAISGNWLLLSSFVIGTVFGMGYMVFLAPPPGGGWYDDYRFWFACVIYGIGLGGIASLFFDTLKSVVVAAIIKMVKPAVMSPEGKQLAEDGK